MAPVAPPRTVRPSTPPPHPQEPSSSQTPPSPSPSESLPKPNGMCCSWKSNYILLTWENALNFSISFSYKHLCFSVRKSPASRQEKQLALLLARQKDFKVAALQAKSRGEVNQAKEYLRLSKGFDKLIEATQSGLPVDLKTVSTVFIFSCIGEMALNLYFFYSINLNRLCCTL